MTNSTWLKVHIKGPAQEKSIVAGTQTGWQNILNENGRRCTLKKHCSQTLGKASSTKTKKNPHPNHLYQQNHTPLSMQEKCWLVRIFFRINCSHGKSQMWIHVLSSCLYSKRMCNEPSNTVPLTVILKKKKRAALLLVNAHPNTISKNSSYC